MVRNALEVRGLARRYRVGWLGRTRTALTGLELVLAPGESLGLVGPNGSGKSTLLRILAGIEQPSAGTVRVFGGTLSERSTRRRIGYLPDGFPFPDELGPRAVLELLGSLHGLARAERRRATDELLARVGLSAEARTPLGRFSLGMKRRFGLCQALLHRPDLLLLDEPTAGLDAQGYVVLDELLREARARGATLVLASHVALELEAHCARTVVLVSGRLAASGSTAELLGERGRLLALYRELAARAPEA
jgi:ABC-2 type transport system ATP-binding protein